MILIIAIMLILSFSVGIVFSASLTQSIEVSFDAVKRIFIDKEEKIPPDDMKPFIYNGMTYVSLRFVSEALGKEVDWNEGTGTVYIGEKPDDLKNVVIDDPLTTLGIFRIDENNKDEWKSGENGVCAVLGRTVGTGKTMARIMSNFKGSNELKSLHYAVEVEVTFYGDKSSVAGIAFGNLYNIVGISVLFGDEETFKLDSPGRPTVIIGKPYKLKVIRDYEKFDLYLNGVFLETQEYIALDSSRNPREYVPEREYFEGRTDQYIGLYTTMPMKITMGIPIEGDVFFKNFRVTILDD